MGLRVYVGDKSRPVEVELEAHVEGNLSIQTSMVILGTLDVIIGVVSQHDNLRFMLHLLFKKMCQKILWNELR